MLSVFSREEIIRPIHAGLRMYIEDNPRFHAQRKKFIEITESWWKDAKLIDLPIVPFAAKRDGKWFAIAKVFAATGLLEQPNEE